MNDPGPAPDFYRQPRGDQIFSRPEPSNTNSGQASHSETQIRTTHDSDAPPAYDQLSIAPPSAEESSARQASTCTNTATQGNAVQDGSRRNMMKQKWREMKEEDERRRAERYQVVPVSEADRITGLDRHREEEAKKSSERKRGGAALLGILSLS